MKRSNIEAVLKGAREQGTLRPGGLALLERALSGDSAAGRRFEVLHRRRTGVVLTVAFPRAAGLGDWVVVGKGVAAKILADRG